MNSAADIKRQLQHIFLSLAEDHNRRVTKRMTQNTSSVTKVLESNEYYSLCIGQSADYGQTAYLIQNREHEVIEFETRIYPQAHLTFHQLTDTMKSIAMNGIGGVSEPTDNVTPLFSGKFN